jgi:hypothetical protein
MSCCLVSKGAINALLRVYFGYIKALINTAGIAGIAIEELVCDIKAPVRLYCSSSTALLRLY